MTRALKRAGKILKHLSEAFFWVAGLACFVALPVLTSPVAVSSTILLAHLLVFGVFVCTMNMCVRLPYRRAWRAGASALFALYYLYVVFANLFEKSWGLKFRLSLLTDSFDVAWDTIRQTVGVSLFLTSLAGLFAALALVFLWWNRLGEVMGRNRSSFLGAAAGFGVAVSAHVFLIGTPFFSWDYVSAIMGNPPAVGATQQNLQDISIDSKENVFIVQLESVNALAANGDLVLGDKKYKGMFIPVMKKVAEDGVFFPYFFGNTFPTKRAQNVILCDVIGFADGKETTAFEDCLPKFLVTSGYKTIVFRSDDLSFSNEGAFLEKTGFQTVLNKTIMKEGDKKYSWGYDDCLFYQRAFEYLKENYPDPEKLFVYFEVSTHHPPYKGKAEYSFLNKFVDSKGFVEGYLNSLLAQDYCVGTFYKEYKAYARQNSHLFVTGDHSVRMGLQEQPGYMQGLNTDRLLTSMAYVPPSGRGGEFARGKVATDTFHSQADMLPTILDLLGGPPLQNSFAYELSAKAGSDASYEKCHLLASMLGGPDLELGIVKGGKYYRYAFAEQKLYSADVNSADAKGNLLLKDPVLVSKNMSLEDFKRDYYCDRYKTP